MKGCLICGFIHLSNDAIAVGRFCQDGPLGYRSRLSPQAPMRQTRTEAEIDTCKYRTEAVERTPNHRQLTLPFLPPNVELTCRQQPAQGE